MSDRGRVLVIEDDESIRTVVQLTLADEGYDVHTAENGVIALKSLETVQPDVVLLDMKMPVMDGWEFAVALKQTANRARVIVLTASSDAADRAGAVGADGFLAKPFDLDDLVRVVGEHMPRG